MNGREIDERRTDTKRKIAAQMELIKSLETQSENVVALGDVKQVVATKKELTAARELLDGLELVLKSYEKKSKDFTEKREPEAAKIRKHLQERWPAGVAEYDKLRVLHESEAPIIDKITAFNNENRTLAGQHETLIGDSISIPQIPIPHELLAAANVKLGPLPKSLDVRLGSEREEQRLADLFKEQAPIVNRILKLAGQAWPDCPACGTRMLAGRQGPNGPAYELSQDGAKGFANFRCPQNGHGHWTKHIAFPARPIAEMMIGIKGSSSLFATLPPNPTLSHGLELQA